MEALLPILKDFGFPIALCVVLLFAIRQQNAALVKAYTDRISVLERLVKINSDKIDELELDRIRRADEYGHTLKDMAVRYGNILRDHDQLTREMLAFLRRLADSVGVMASRPCMHDTPAPHRPSVKVPSSAEIPADPTKAPTDRYGNGG
jgi:hypothetical protein